MNEQHGAVDAQDEAEAVAEAPGADEEIVPDAVPVDADAQTDAPGIVLDAAVADEGATEIPAESPAEAVVRLEAELAAAQAEAAANLEQMKRVAAEFQNSKRRQEKQLADAIDRAGAHIVQSLLPIVDDFQLAFRNVPENLAEGDVAWLDGFRQIQKKLQDVLSTQGVELIAPEGEFDPNLHEAISSEPHDDVPSGHIIETLRAGYTHKGRVLRPALVRVAG